jgi:hypothetical protein
MPFIAHADLGWTPVTARVRERYLVSRQQGAASLTIKEVEIAPQWESRLHTHRVSGPGPGGAGPFHAGGRIESARTDVATASREIAI